MATHGYSVTTCESSIRNQDASALAAAYASLLSRKGGECGLRDAGDGHLFPRADEEPAYTGRHGTCKEPGRQHHIPAEEDDCTYKQGERGRGQDDGDREAAGRA